MIHRPCSPLIFPAAPDVRSLDELESNISPEVQGHESETEDQRQNRDRKNKKRQGRLHQARQCKEAWTKFEFDLAEYEKKKAEHEDEDRHAIGRGRTR
jgi:hypothetical protein